VKNPPAPTLIVEGANDDSTPLMRIAQWCSVCEVMVTDRLVDVSNYKADAATAAIAGDWGSEDGEGWLEHVREKHAGRRDPG
jgi:hypothetical protein